MDQSNSRKRKRTNGLGSLGNRITHAAIAGLVSGLIGEIAEGAEDFDFLDNTDEPATSIDDDPELIFIENNIELENDLECF